MKLSEREPCLNLASPYGCKYVEFEGWDEALSRANKIRKKAKRDG